MKYNRLFNNRKLRKELLYYTNLHDYSKEDRQHEGRELYNRLQNKGDDYKGEGYQAEILQELKKSNPNIVKELRDAKGEGAKLKLAARK